MTKQQSLMNQVFHLVDDYLKAVNDGDAPVTRYLPPGKLKKSIDLSLPEEGSGNEDLIEQVKNYLYYCVKTRHPQFFNQLYGGGTMPALVGEIITALTNTSMYTYEVSPVATLMEMTLLEKMNELVGFTEGEGTFVTGGSNANLLALLCARNRCLPLAGEQGLQQQPLLSLFISSEAHYSFEKAANVLGIGRKRVYQVAADKLGRMQPEKLEEKIRNSLERGEQPFFVAATGGTTKMGAYDPIPAIASLSKRYGLWLHVDGSFGGSVLLSSAHRKLLQGLEAADSFAWNPHKLMNVPLICSVLLLRSRGILRENLQMEESDYIFHDHENMSYDLGQMSLQCGRRVDSLKLWLAWRYFGDKGYEARINHLVDLAAAATEKVKGHPSLELLAPSQSFIVNFRYLPKKGTDRDRFNIKLRNTLNRRGLSLVNYCRIEDNIAIRLVLANPDISDSDLDLFFANLLKTAVSLDK